MQPILARAGWAVVKVTRTGELCRKCQKSENDNKLDASLIDLAKKDTVIFLRGVFCNFDSI